MFPLTHSSDGEEIRVKCLNCTHEDKCRLNELGCIEGATGTIISNQKNVILKVGETRLAITKEIASTIFVASLN